MRYWIGLVLLYAAVVGAQEPLPPIREISFDGNVTTRPKVMLREMSVHVGDPADPKKVEQSRQAILDLGLFKSVEVRQEPVDDGVRLVYTVKEKYYLLPYPRLSANLDGQYGYGAELRWNNIGGLNHSFRALITQSSSNRDGYGKQNNYTLNYTAPFIWDTPYNLSLSGAHVSTPMQDATTQKPYTELFDTAQILVSRIFSTTAASQGWTIGGGWLSQHEDRYGPGAPPAYGDANAVVAYTEYRDLHFKVFSEEGQLFSARSEVAIKGAASDYSYTLARLGYDRYVPLGDVPHQTMQLSGAVGGYFNGPEGVPHYSLGGSGNLRGYPSYFLSGNSFYYLAAIYQRPVGWEWLRLMVALENGNVAEGANRELFGRASTSLGVGLRVRFSWFVDLEFEAGWAIPLDRRSTGRFFGGRL